MRSLKVGPAMVLRANKSYELHLMVLDIFDSEPRRKPTGKQDKDDLYRAQNGKCNYCGRKPGKAYLHVDHKNPLARGGSDRITNKQLLCSQCNTRKGAMRDGNFRSRFKLTPTRQAKHLPIKVIPQKYFDEVTKTTASRRAKRRRKEENEWFF